MTLEFKEIKLKPSDMFDITKYPGEGLYIVDDGALWQLVSNLNGAVYAIPLPNKDIFEQYAERAIDQAQRDVLKFVEYKLSSIIELLGKPQQSQGGVNMQEITQLVIAAQKPEVLKDL